ncbi:hypothetical protein F511_31148 [Dorcoceras hygrometricum]|uniref:WRC domain-containing protein n=1 Tax=Dorcoceras hygrometricum TaxID=472368 RepID=A0A2Z7BTY6_9LAMI|nr:hypothetical protein F511_31148 [Dorcoceras hygrometricum]
MRIRKHAKISPLIYATSSLDPGTLHLQAHFCQLNQSPWDVMNFSPPPPSPPPSQEISAKVNGNDRFAGSGSSRDSIAVIGRERMVELDQATKWEHSGSICGGAASEEESGTSPKEGPITLCCKTDGKSWQCRREAAKGNSLCEHHVRSYSNNSAHSASNNVTVKSSVDDRGRPRIKKRATQSLSNPYVFYYYSGFGPRWGRKRGGEVSKNIDRELNMHKEASSSCYFEDEEIEGVDEDEKKKQEIGKKRGRKPIKARSLKSLM